jgi:predicted transcriptional regulator
VAYDDFPTELVEFVALNIDSVEQIVILQILHDHPEISRTTSELTRELRSSETSIERRLEGLYRKGVLARPEHADIGKHIYLPANDSARKSIEDLLTAFGERPSRVVEMVYSKPPAAIKAFSDAFKFRKEEK